MDDRNTIVIERTFYPHKVKYLWKNDVTNTLNDLSENLNSPFSSARPDYKKFSTGMLAENAYHVVATIDQAYNKRAIGVHIEIKGTEQDYLAIKSVIEVYFSNRHIDCIWNRRMQSPAEVMSKITKIYQDLHKALAGYDGKEKIELCDRNDRNGWLRFGFNREKIASEMELCGLCARTGEYLEKIIQEIKTQADHKTGEISKLEKELEQNNIQKTNLKQQAKTEIDSDKLLKLMQKVCKKYTKEAGKEFEDLLESSVDKKYLDKARITECVKGAITGTDLKEIQNRLVKNFNNDIKQYIDEVNMTGINFGNKCIEKLKEIFLKEVYDSKEFTKEQQETVRQRVFSGVSVNASYHTLRRLESQMSVEHFSCGKKGYAEKDVCREYEKKMRNVLKDKRKAVLDGNSKLFEEWGNTFIKKLKECDLDPQPDNLQNEGQLRKRIAVCQQEKRKLVSLQNVFQNGRNNIDAMISS